MHKSVAKNAQSCVHDVVQQVGIEEHTVWAQGLQLAGSAAPAVHSLCEQVPHVPQSLGHDAHVSLALHVPLPHTGQGPQSEGQVEHVSLALHVPFPHVEHDWPQMLETSPTHWLSQEFVQQNESVWQINATHGSQAGLRATPVVHLLWAQVHAPQSVEHVEHVSPAWHTPLPHTGGHAPQSVAQVEHVSPA